MKKEFTPLSFLTKQMGKEILALFCPASYKPTRFFALAAVIGCMLLTLSATTVSAQVDASAAVSAPITTDAIPQAGWKAPVDYSAVIVTERANTVIVLATPDLKAAKVALYTGYDRMLAYMQTDLASNMPIEEIAAKNYTKVVQESSVDPVLVNMQADEFSALYDALVQMLHQ